MLARAPSRFTPAQSPTKADCVQRGLSSALCIGRVAPHHTSTASTLRKFTATLSTGIRASGMSNPV
jgi:hypothetical protein